MSDVAVANGVSPNQELIIQQRVSNHKLKSAVKRLTEERDVARGEVTRLNTDNQKLIQAADTGASQKRVKQLEGELNTIKHQKVFEAKAKKAGVQESAVDAAWKLSGYTAEGEPDEAKLDEVVTGLKTSSPFLFGQPTVEANPDEPTRPDHKAAGAGKGGMAPDASVRQQFLNAIIPTGDPRLQNSKWMMDNQEAMQASAKARIALGKYEPIMMPTS